ncbi:MAG TPA: phytanoyl-CoA dioxygenase family protein [Chryseolinea sp.]|nr:phytanoyl-CoA dioxygenase family protein [Chryseolinea sp.]
MKTADHVETFGYSQPTALLSPAQLEQALYANVKYPARLLPWLKGRHAVDRTTAEIAHHPELLKILREILGEDILLWSSQIIKQTPGKRLHWHVDQEHKVWKGVSVWIALKNVQPFKSVSIVSGSHLFNSDPADCISEKGDPQQLQLVISKQSGDSKIVDVNIKDGEFFIFHGKTWHATRNETDSSRFALLLQYCTPDQKVMAVKDMQYPDIKWHSFSPECLLVSGSDRHKVNRVITMGQVGTLNRKFRSAFVYAPHTLVYKIRKKLFA